MAPAYYLAPALVKLRDEINEKYPHRDKKSDGWIGDASHSARASDHNPDGRGMVHAIDVDRDGINVRWLLNATIGAPRVNYVIFNKVIYSRVRGFKPKAYDGLNSHAHHIHVSLRYGGKYENDIRSWINTGDDMPTPKEIAHAVWEDDIIPNDDNPKNPTWRAKNALTKVQTDVDQLQASIKTILNKLDVVLNQK